MKGTNWKLANWPHSRFQAFTDTTISAPSIRAETNSWDLVINTFISWVLYTYKIILGSTEINCNHAEGWMNLNLSVSSCSSVFVNLHLGSYKRNYMLSTNISFLHPLDLSATEHDGLSEMTVSDGSRQEAIIFKKMNRGVIKRLQLTFSQFLQCIFLDVLREPARSHLELSIHLLQMSQHHKVIHHGFHPV